MDNNGEEKPGTARLHGNESAETRWGMGRRRSGTRYDMIKSSRSLPEREIKARAMRPDLGKKMAVSSILAERSQDSKWGLRQNEEEGKGTQ